MKSHFKKLAAATAAFLGSVAPGVAISSHARPANTLCRIDERVEFSCHVKSRIVSLCSTQGADNGASLHYRYGRPDWVENEFSATSENANRFFTTLSPANPRAQVIQVWFDRGDTRYLLTQCVGGNCVRDAGLAVLRGGQVLMNESCEATGVGDRLVFGVGLLSFGPVGSSVDIGALTSGTPMLRREDADNSIETLYGNRVLK